MTKAAIVKRRDGKWVLLTKDSSRVLGTHENPQDAYKQEYAIQKSKERQKSASPEASPTPAQIDSGNYKKDHLKVHGLSVTIENLKGSTRKGIEHGNRWSVKMPCDYGYIRGFTGNDGDGVDCYVGPNTDSYMVYVVSQRNLSTGRFDEHKCMLGFKKKEQAVATYLKGFSDGAGIRRLMGVKSMPIPQFKEWLGNKANMKKQASAKDRLKVKVAELYKTKGYTEPMQKAKDVQPKQAPIKLKKLQTYTATQAPAMPKIASVALDMVANGLIGLIKQSQAQTPSLPPAPAPIAPAPALKAPTPAPTYKDPFTEIPRIAHEEVQQSIDMGNWGSSEAGNTYSKSQYGLAPHQLSNNQYDLLKSHYINNVRQAPAPAPSAPAVDRPIPMPQGPQVSDFMMGGRYFGKTPAQVQAQVPAQVPMAPAAAAAAAAPVAPAPVAAPAPVSNRVATSPVIEAQKNRQYVYDTNNTVRAAIARGPDAFAAVASTMLPEQLMKYKSLFENELRTKPNTPNKDNLKKMLESINAHGRLSIADQSSPNKPTASAEGVMA